jgi:hypothetical protein
MSPASQPMVIFAESTGLAGGGRYAASALSGIGAVVTVAALGSYNATTSDS